MRNTIVDTAELLLLWCQMQVQNMVCSFQQRYPAQELSIRRAAFNPLTFHVASQRIVSHSQLLFVSSDIDYSGVISGPFQWPANAQEGAHRGIFNPEFLRRCISIEPAAIVLAWAQIMVSKKGGILIIC